MSSIPVVTPADLPAMRTAARARSRRWLRSVAFAGLCAYGVERWGRLLGHPSWWRLYGLAALAVGFAELVPLARRFASGLGEHGRLWGRLAGAVLAAAMIVAAFAIAGLRVAWIWHVRIAVSIRAIGHGLNAMGTVLVPYLGHAYPVRLVMTLGAAILLLDAAAALAFLGSPGGEIGDGRRAAAALPLVALAIVPSTLVSVRAPAIQGLILFGLLALFVWGERVLIGRRGAALGLACAAGLVGLIAVPALSSSRPWVNYQAWGDVGAGDGPESFNWNQTYGPLSWPQHGKTMFTVSAQTGDYWKAEDLTTFNGTAWVEGPVPSGSGQGGLLAESNVVLTAATIKSTPTTPALPSPSVAAVRRYTHRAEVRIGSMSTFDVIGGSGITLRPQIAGGVAESSAPGTWRAFRPLGPGDTYSVTTYSPTPSATQLQNASEQTYPWAALGSDLSLTLPENRESSAELTFPGFHQPLGRLRSAALKSSPYGSAVTLAQRLAAQSSSPYAFVRAVQRYLDDGRYVYDQRPQTARYPLLDFLFQSRVGYCQQFSGSMAMLLRMGGVPARVAAGFTPGSLDKKRHLWTVSDTDAHAWVEAWFPTYGWVRFDPTPSNAPALRNSALSDEPRPGEVNKAFDLGHSAQPVTRKRTATTTHSTTTHAAGAAGGSSSGGSGSGGWPWIAGGVVVALLLGGGLWTRSRRGPADRLGELERALARTGRPLPGGATLVSLETRFHGSPDAAAYVRTLRLERYGGAARAPSSSGRRAVRSELASGLGVTGRVRALWALPPRPWRRGSSEDGEVSPARR
jgi:transglutaminase-like putative cysteine protease